MAALSDEAYVAARARGEELLQSEPRAEAVRYDAETRRVVIELVNGCAYMFPVRLVQDLVGAESDSLEDVEIAGVGFDLYWPRLDVDLYVPAVVAGVFGTRDWMKTALARKAGVVTSEAKARAARENGRKGGRPRKMA